MKIIAVDNYNRDWISDLLICEHVCNQLTAEAICELLNKNNDMWIHKIVPDDHVLYEFKP